MCQIVAIFGNTCKSGPWTGVRCNQNIYIGFLCPVGSRPDLNANFEIPSLTGVLCHDPEICGCLVWRISCIFITFWTWRREGVPMHPIGAVMVEYDGRGLLTLTPAASELETASRWRLALFGTVARQRRSDPSERIDSQRNEDIG